MYGVRTSVRADRDIASLRQRASRQDFERMRAAMKTLAEQPRPHGVQKIRGREIVYRIRVGNYRVIYEVYDKENMVLISRVLRRNETTYRT